MGINGVYNLILFIPPFLLIFLHWVGTIRKRNGVEDLKYLLKYEMTKEELSNTEKAMTEALLELEKVKQQIANYKKTKKSTLIAEVIITGYLELITVGLVSEYSPDYYFQLLLAIGVALILGILSCLYLSD